MEKKQCGDCYHWELTAGAVQHGECCATPPKVILQHDGEFESHFPTTAASERCGFWRALETKEAPEHGAG